jgi:hypothetical protein
MRHNKYDVCLCAICKEEFTPRTGNAKYCDKCRATGKVEKEKQLKAKKKEQKKPKISWAEIAKICEENRCSYGQAVARGLL